MMSLRRAMRVLTAQEREYTAACRRPPEAVVEARAAALASSDVRGLRYLQRVCGNRAVGRIITERSEIRVARDTAESGGFRITGSSSFVRTVLADLASINATRSGAALLGDMAANRAPWYRSLIRIESGACGFLPTGISYNASGCPVGGCPGAWTSVPNYVYLYHEIVHAYLYYIAGKGTHAERECMATGLGAYFTSIPYNENRLRCELGLPVRPCYDGECRSHAAPVCP